MTKNSNIEDFTCCICLGGNFKYLNFGYHFNDRDLLGVKCRNCGLIFIHPQPEPEEIKSLYNEEYFVSENLHVRPHGRSDYFESVESQKETTHYQRGLEFIEKFIEKGSLLEIGCGPGHFLKLANECGWNVTGVELSEYAANYARKQFGLQVFTGDLSTVELPHKSFNVIFMGDLLEHVPDPKELLLSLRHYLSDKGILFLEIPSVTNGLFSRFGNLLLTILGKVKYINLPPYHLFEFTPRSCKRLLESTGYNIVKIKQGLVSPTDIGLRDSPLINSAKFILQSVNYVITKLTGLFGDRLTVIAKPVI